MIAMKEKPILFNGDMVRAILEGRKTQTRRVFKDKNWNVDREFNDEGWPIACDSEGNWYDVKCPYGQVGDQLWVRETHFVVPGKGNAFGEKILYRADGGNLEAQIKEAGEKWKPSIFMPRSASRIDLLIKDIRVERLQDISEKDAIAEGIKPFKHKDTSYRYRDNDKHGYGSATGAFRALWQLINGEKSWDKNPWSWVIEFEKIEDQGKAAA